MSDGQRSNPFNSKGAIRDASLFFGRKRELRKILDLVEKMLSVSIVGERMIGKSSLLRYVVQTAGPDRLAKPDYHFIYLDMEKVESAEEFFERVCEEIEQVTGGSSASHGTTDARRNFERLLKGQKIVLCLDEFEQVTDNPDFDDHFYKLLRSLAQDGNLALVLATKQGLNELYRGDDGLTSPFCNIFTCLPLGQMPEDEARQMITEPLDKTGIRFSEEETVFILELAEGYPYRINLACRLLCEAKLSDQPHPDKIRKDFEAILAQSKPAKRAGRPTVDRSVVAAEPENTPSARTGQVGRETGRLTRFLRVMVIVLPIIGGLFGWFGVQLSAAWAGWTAICCFILVIFLILLDLTGIKEWSRRS